MFSRPMKGDAHAKLADVIFFHLNQGQYELFLTQIGKVHEAIGKTNWPVSYEWHALVSGGEGPTLALVLMKSSWADMKEPEVSFPAMLEKAFGKQEASAIMKGFGESIHCERSQLLRYREDLSYVPAAKK
jgi:hypothetical protein